MYYVSMTDTAMSDWGPAEGKHNKLVFACESYEEAQIVAENARNRTEQKHIRISRKKPHYPCDRYYTQYKTKEDAPSWYVPGYFA